MLNWFKDPSQKLLKWKQDHKNTCELHLLDFNRHQFRKSSNVIHLERKGPKLQVIDLLPHSKEIIFEGDEANFILKTDEWKNEAKHLIEEHFKNKINEFTSFAKEHIPDQGDPANEFKAQEWLKTPLIVLNNALDAKTNEQTIQTTIFIGQKENRFEIRVIIYNLDLAFNYDAKMKALVVTCFNKKDAAEFNYSKPDLEALFQVNAFSVIDSAIELVRKISIKILEEV